MHCSAVVRVGRLVITGRKRLKGGVFDLKSSIEQAANSRKIVLRNTKRVLAGDLEELCKY